MRKATLSQACEHGNNSACFNHPKERCEVFMTYQPLLALQASSALYHHGREAVCLQAMNLISIAQQSGDVSADMYVKYSGMGPIQPPSMAGVEQLVAKMQQETQNPFLTNGFPTPDKPPLGADRSSRPPALGIPAGPSPRSSQASLPHLCSAS